MAVSLSERGFNAVSGILVLILVVEIVVIVRLNRYAIDAFISFG